MTSRSHMLTSPTLQRGVLVPALLIAIFFFCAPDEAQAQVYDPTTISIPPLEVDPLEKDYFQPSGSSFSYDNFAMYEAIFLTEFLLWNQLMMSTALGYRSYSPENEFLESQSGLMDIPISLKWYLYMNAQINLALAGYGTLPVGREEVDAGLFNFGLFAFARWLAFERVRFIGKVGANFYEPEFADQDREVLLRAVASAYYLLTDALMLFSTIDLQQNREFGSPINTPSSLSGGVNYQLNNRFSIAGTIGTGLGEDEAGIILALYLTTSLSLFR